MSDHYYSSSEEAENAFYKAFEKADLNAMMTVWLDEDYVECIHPMSERLMGVTAIRDSWQEIFKNSTDVEFETVETRQIKHRGLAVHIVTEHLRTKSGQTAHILATNIYENTSKGWRMILHHASPAPRQQAPVASKTIH